MQALKIVMVTYNVYRNEKIPDLIWTEPGLILAQISGHRYKVRCLLGMQEMNLCFWRIIMKYMHAREWWRESV